VRIPRRDIVDGLTAADVADAMVRADSIRYSTTSCSASTTTRRSPVEP
jgi:hypothetical protein